MKLSLRKLFNLPNAVSMLRLMMVPVMIALALLQQPVLFLAAVLFSGFTDVLDGFLARTLDEITEFGSHLDSWGDFAIYTCMAIGAWLLWPDIVRQELYWILAIIASFTLPVLFGLIKFRTLTSYHTWSVKIAVLLTFISYVILFGELHSMPFHIAAIACVIAATEEIIITALMKHEHVDIRSARQAWLLHRAGK